MSERMGCRSQGHEWTTQVSLAGRARLRRCREQCGGGMTVGATATDGSGWAVTTPDLPRPATAVREESFDPSEEGLADGDRICQAAGGHRAVSQHEEVPG